MTIASASIALLRDLLDSFAPALGTVGRATVLSGSLFTGDVTVTPSTDLITTAAPHGLVTGSRVRISASTTAPSPLITTTDYFVIVVSSTTLKLASSLAEAQGGVPINIVDAGSGTMSVSEQALNTNDPLSVLLNKEVVHAGFTARPAITDVGAAVQVGNGAEKLPIEVSIINSGGTSLVYKHILLLFGSSVSATIGSSTGVDSQSLVTVTDQTITAGNSNLLAITLRLI